MQVLFLMGGKPQSFPNSTDHPLYLTDISGRLILEQQIDLCRGLLPSRFIFCVRSAEVQRFRIDTVIERLVGNSAIVYINGSTKGAICTAMLAINQINSGEELLIISVDDLLDFSRNEILAFFRSNECDAGIVAFPSVHPRYSFAKEAECGIVVEVAEKVVISKNALASFYYFKKGADFVSSAMEVVRKDSPISGSFYISQTLNEMILKHRKVTLFKVPSENFYPLKTESQMAKYMLELQQQTSWK
jgi:hypothetical protein